MEMNCVQLERHNYTVSHDITCIKKFSHTHLISMCDRVYHTHHTCICDMYYPHQMLNLLKACAMPLEKQIQIISENVVLLTRTVLLLLGTICQLLQSALKIQF